MLSPNLLSNLLSKSLFSFWVIFGLFAFYSTSIAQSVSHKQLSKEEVKTTFTKEIKTSLGIHYPIFRVYTYWDKEGKSYLVLAENPSKTIDGKEASNKIQEVHVRHNGSKLIKISETNNNLLEDQFESSIWFWTKYIALDDYDGDGIIDPIVAYGSAGINGFDDGRIHFIIHYKGKKIMIRHQNGVLDADRNTKVDESFYILPQKIQNKVKEIMSSMEDKDQAIFPFGWIEAMSNKKTYFDEK